jgi:hypothetical protein
MLRTASEVRLRIYGGYGKSYDAAFDVAGLEGAMEPLKRRCRRL